MNALQKLTYKASSSKLFIVIFHVNTTLSYGILKIVAGAIAVIKLTHYVTILQSAVWFVISGNT